MIGKMIPKLINKPEVKKLFTKIKKKNTLIPKAKPIKYTSSNKSGIVTSKGLLSNNIKTSKKNLLGS